MSERKKALEKARRRDAKKKSLAQFLDHRNFDYFQEFLEAFHCSLPEEKLKWFAKTLPFMFRREDNAPHIEVGGDIVMNKIESPQKFMEILKSDPFLEVGKLVEGEIVNARANEVSGLQSDTSTDQSHGNGNADDGSSGGGSENPAAGSVEEGNQDGRRKRRPPRSRKVADGGSGE